MIDSDADHSRSVLAHRNIHDVTMGIAISAYRVGKYQRVNDYDERSQSIVLNMTLVSIPPRIIPRQDAIHLQIQI